MLDEARKLRSDTLAVAASLLPREPSPCYPVSQKDTPQASRRHRSKGSCCCSCCRAAASSSELNSSGCSRSTLAVLLQFTVTHGMLRSDLTQRLRSHLTQHAGMGSEAKVIEPAGGRSGHLKLLGPLYLAARQAGHVQTHTAVHIDRGNKQN